MATNNSLDLNAKGVAYYNGTGTFSAPTLTSNAIVLGDSASTNNITTTIALTNGQILIGSTGSTPVLTTLTGGTGIAVTNGAGSISIGVVGGGLPWTSVAGSALAMVENNGYIANHATLVTFTLPVTCAQGSIFAITGGTSGNGLWKILQNAGQVIHFISTPTTTGIGGSIANIAQFQTIYVLCITANTTFAVTSSTGAGFTIV
jgi:hypothetical protein